MPQTDIDGAALLAERLRSKVEQETRITISGGVAMAMDGETENDLLNRADAAMYQAKQAGRNRVFVHRVDKMQPVTQSTGLTKATPPAPIGCCA
jgi:diguanylate cyclase (GGDEF)-like protein